MTRRAGVFFLGTAIAGLAAQPMPLRGETLRLPEAGIGIEVPAGWTALEPEAVLLFDRMLRAAAGRNDGETFQIVGLVIRGKPEDFVLLGSAGIFMAAVRGFEKPEDVVTYLVKAEKVVLTKLGSTGQLLAGLIRVDQGADGGQAGTVGWDDEAGMMYIELKATPAQGTATRNRIYGIPTKTQLVLAGVIGVEESDSPTFVQATSAIRSVQVDAEVVVAPKFNAELKELVTSGAIEKLRLGAHAGKGAPPGDPFNGGMSKADGLRTRGDLAGAETQLRSALEHAERALEADAESKLWLGNRVSVLYNLGRAVGEQGREAEGLALLERAIAEAQALAERWPEETTWTKLAEAHSRRAFLLARFKRHDQAVADFEQVLAARRMIAGRNPAPGSTKAVAGALGALSQEWRSLGNKEEAVRHAEEAAVILRELRESVPTDEGVAAALLRLLGLLRWVTEDSGDVERAKAVVAESLQIAEAFAGPGRPRELKGEICRAWLSAASFRRRHKAATQEEIAAFYEKGIALGDDLEETGRVTPEVASELKAARAAIEELRSAKQR